MKTGLEAEWPLEMMAEALGVSPRALLRWGERILDDSQCGRRGRPLSIDEAAQTKIRACYLKHFGQWGPRVLADWCKREGIGTWSAGTVAVVIADLRPEKEPKPDPIRLDVKASDVMWSEDGTEFGKDNRKRELLVVQDDHARLKIDWKLAPGPANSQDVEKYLRRAFESHGPPLVLKHDNDGIFHTPAVAELLAEYEVLDLTSPPEWPRYNGKQERSMRDIKSYERAMRKHGVGGRLDERIQVTMHDLNVDRPRPCLGGCTATEAYKEGKIGLPERRLFKRSVDEKEEELLDQARSRREERSARRRAIEQTLVSYGLLEIVGAV